jgi:hypothetical protein
MLYKTSPSVKITNLKDMRKNSAFILPPSAKMASMLLIVEFVAQTVPNIARDSDDSC